MRYKMFGLLFKAFNLYTDQDTKLINMSLHDHNTNVSLYLVLSDAHVHCSELLVMREIIIYLVNY